VSEYYRNPRKRDGLFNECKTCCGERQKRTYARNRAAYAGATVTEKKCNVCAELRPAKDFGMNRFRKSGLEPTCRDCRAEQQYGLSTGEYDRMAADQGGTCAICDAPPPEGKRLYVDHCHRTGHARGLLCRDCNLGIGKFNDDIDRLRSAVKYLERGW
jgi:hypothetical protein